MGDCLTQLFFYLRIVIYCVNGNNISIQLLNEPFYVRYASIWELIIKQK